MFSTQYDKERKQWTGRRVVPLYNPKISLVQVVLKSCINFGSKVAQVIEIEIETFIFAVRVFIQIALIRSK